MVVPLSFAGEGGRKVSKHPVLDAFSNCNQLSMAFSIGYYVLEVTWLYSSMLGLL